MIWNMEEKVFKIEKLTAVSFISKDLITNSAWSIPDFLSKLFWDSFKECILRKKALPLHGREADIQFTYAPYNFCNLDDDENYSVGFKLKALRLRTRGRRSNQLHAEQLTTLASVKDDYINLLNDKIKASGLLSQT